MLKIMGSDGTALAAVPMASVRATSRLGALRRRLDFPDGSSFDTQDNDAMDSLLRRGGTLHRLESSWRLALAALVCVVLSGAAFVWFAIPAAAGWMARQTPPAIAAVMTAQTLAALDQLAMSPSHMPLSRQQQLRALLAQMAANAPRGADGYRLVFRDAPDIGPNAFALPDGTIVITDQLLSLSRSDAEIQGVLGHEMSHVNHAHGLQRVYQASLVPAAIAFVTGDASQIGHFASLLPGVLLQSAYSRAFEQQADDDAARLMHRIGKDPAALADLLERMDHKVCGQQPDCGSSWLGSHPATAERAKRLRNS